MPSIQAIIEEYKNRNPTERLYLFLQYPGLRQLFDQIDDDVRRLSRLESCSRRLFGVESPDVATWMPPDRGGGQDDPAAIGPGCIGLCEKREAGSKSFVLRQTVLELLSAAVDRRQQNLSLLVGG